MSFFPNKPHAIICPATLGTVVMNSPSPFIQQWFAVTAGPVGTGKAKLCKKVGSADKEFIDQTREIKVRISHTSIVAGSSRKKIPAVGEV